MVVGQVFDWRRVSLSNHLMSSVKHPDAIKLSSTMLFALRCIQSY